MNGIALIIFLFVFERGFMLTVLFMITNFPKLQCVILTLVLLLFSALPVSADLLDEGKTDSTIKMLVFPKSLRVIESRGDEMNAVFSDPKRIRKTLLKLDPARVAPAKSGEPIKGPVTRDSLGQLAKQYSEDIIFIFRRTLDDTKNAIRHQGLLYLSKQKKVLALEESMNSGSLQEMDVAGLKTLALEARKVLHSNKFEKRQSAY
jgi:hypothetical protein